MLFHPPPHVRNEKETKIEEDIVIRARDGIPLDQHLAYWSKSKLLVPHKYHDQKTDKVTTAMQQLVKCMQMSSKWKE